MLSLELSADQEDRLNSILDRGLESFSQSPEPISVSKLSNSYISDTSSILKSDLGSLQSKIANLESRLSGTKNSYKAHKTPNKFRSESPTQTILRNLQKSELELEELENSITMTPNKKELLPKKNDNIRAELVSERQRNIQKRKENDSLRKKLNYKEDLESKLIRLQEDYNTLMQSFDRSENIRLKQKEVIEGLKSEIVECDDKLSEENIEINRSSRQQNKLSTKKTVYKKTLARKPW